MYSRYFRYSGYPIKLLMVPYIAVLHVLWVPDIGTLDAMGALYRYPWLHKKYSRYFRYPTQVLLISYIVHRYNRYSRYPT